MCRRHPSGGGAVGRREAGEDEAGAGAGALADADGGVEVGGVEEDVGGGPDGEAEPAGPAEGEARRVEADAGAVGLEAAVGIIPAGRRHGVGRRGLCARRYLAGGT